MIERPSTALLAFLASGFAIAMALAPAAAAPLMSGCGADCKQRTCADLGYDNSLTFMSCAACGDGTGCDIDLEDASGSSFYHCSDSDGKNCSTEEGLVSAEESYCAG
jgi:hypothetical protein